jgi:hypothetical protein
MSAVITEPHLRWTKCRQAQTRQFEEHTTHRSESLFMHTAATNCRLPPAVSFACSHMPQPHKNPPHVVKRLQNPPFLTSQEQGPAPLARCRPDGLEPSPANSQTASSCLRVLPVPAPLAWFQTQHLKRTLSACGQTYPTIRLACVLAALRPSSLPPPAQLSGRLGIQLWKE